MAENDTPPNSSAHDGAQADTGNAGGNVTSQISPESLANGVDNGPAVGIVSQYVKDLSVENPNAPAAHAWQDTPQIDVQFNIAAQALGGELHEVELKVRIAAKAESGTAYIVDLTYAAVIGMRNLDEPSMHAFLFAEAPRLVFPFARRVVADAVRDAGFAPLVLDPIDFNGLYMQQLAAQAGQAEGGAGGADGPPAGNA